MTEIKYPLAKNTVQKDDIDALAVWLLTYPRLTMGDLTKQLEEDAAKWTNRNYAVFVNSGSSANLLMIYALKVSNKLKNNKVVIPNLGWCTSIAPFLQFGFEPIMCKTNKTDFGLDLEHLQQIVEQEDPAIVLFVQPLGALIDKNKLLALKMKHGFFLLCDACAAVGSSYNDGTKAGKVGDMSSWSMFYGHQICSAAEGGMVFTDDKDLYNILISIRSHGWMRNNDKDIYDGIFDLYKVDKFNQPFFFVYPGFNVRNSDIAAFVGIRQIKKLDSFVETRNRNHRRYLENLNGLFQCQDVSNNKNVSSISFAFLAKTPEQRKTIVMKLNVIGVENRLYSAGALNKHPFWFERFNKNGRDEFGRTLLEDEMGNIIHSCGLFIPNTQEMTLDDVDNISNFIKSVL